MTLLLYTAETKREKGKLRLCEKKVVRRIVVPKFYELSNRTNNKRSNKIVEI